MTTGRKVIVEHGCNITLEHKAWFFVYTLKENSYVRIIYRIVNDFVEKSNGYNIINEINKIRSKTNLYSYKNSKRFQDIMKLNNKVQYLIYDYAEDILDLNNDIKK